jgi:hypothetical protein
MNKKLILTIVTVLLIGINLFVIHNYDVSESRIARLLTTSILFIIFLAFKGFKNKTVLAAFIFFLISDIFIQKYEEPLYNKLTFITTIIGYIVLALHILPKLSFTKTNKFLIFIFAIVVLINTYMLYELIHMVEFKLIDKTQEFLFYIYGMAMITMGLFGGNYNFRFNSSQSTFCMFFVFSLILSDICAVMAYYLNVNIFYYPDRFFYILGLALMTAYATFDFKEEVLFEEFFEEDEEKPYEFKRLKR